MRQIVAGVGPTLTWSAELSSRDRRLLAFTRTAANVAGTAPLGTILAALLTEVAGATNIDTALVVGGMGSGSDADLLIAGFGDPPGLRAAAAELCRSGAVLARVGGRARVIHHIPQVVAVDERFAPIAGFVGATGWDTLVSVQLSARGQSLGFLLAWYAPGRQPGDTETAFLVAMGDQAAIAINTARLEARHPG